MGSLTPEGPLTAWLTQKSVFYLFLIHLAQFALTICSLFLPSQSHYFTMFIVVLFFAGALTHSVFLFGTHAFYIYINSTGLFFNYFSLRCFPGV